MHYLYSIIEYNNAPFLAKITVEEYDDGKKRAYNVDIIKMSTLSRTQYLEIKSKYRGNLASNVDYISVSELFNFVKEFDNKFNPKKVNPNLLNEDGTPKIVYDQTKTNGQNPVGSGHHSSVTQDNNPFVDNKVPQPTDNVKRKDSTKLTPEEYARQKNYGCVFEDF